MEVRQRLRQWIRGAPVAPAGAMTVLEPAASAISIKQKPEDAPKFARVYKAELDARASIAVTLRSWVGLGRMASGELRQPNGRWVLFDPRAIADKILDPLLVPLIQRHVDEIFRLDAEFMQAVPAQFIDERGQAWVKMPAAAVARIS